jgi:hypothetical protein
MRDRIIPGGVPPWSTEHAEAGETPRTGSGVIGQEEGMALSLANDVSSLTAQANLDRASSTLNATLARLSGGLKLPEHSDGPAADYAPSTPAPAQPSSPETSSGDQGAGSSTDGGQSGQSAALQQALGCADHRLKRP